VTVIGEEAEQALRNVIEAVNAGVFPIKSGRDAADLIKVLHAVSRLESGQITGMTGTLELNPAALTEAIVALQNNALERHQLAQAVPEVERAS
jgi:hypothetical protein